MRVLGIYFGPRVISIVETSGKKILNNIQINRAVFSAGALEERVPDEVKIVTAIMEELRRNKVKANEANICLAGKDLIIRTFEMPMLPSSELPNAVNFEVKKYIPFKVADLVSDFQVLPDKPARKNLILFVGIKREDLDKYLAILEQLKIKSVCIEYAAFSVIRFLRLAGSGTKGIIGVLSTDFQEEGEINYTVLQDGFPLFSRDINLMAGPEGLRSQDKSEAGTILEKFKTEIRVSLDYYHRKFPLKNIQKNFLFCTAEYRAELEGVMQELGFTAQYLDIARYMGKAATFSLSAVKGYSCALFKVAKTALHIDLLLAKAKPKSLAMTEGLMPVERDWAAFFAEVRIQPLVVLFSVFLCLGVLLFGAYQKLPIKKEMENLISLRPKVTTVDPKSSYELLLEKDGEYKTRIETFAQLVRHEFYITEILNALPSLLPKKIWLTNLNFKSGEGQTEFLISGSVYLNDSQKEIELVHEFLANLKNSLVIQKYFRPKEIAIISIEQGKIGALTSTNFNISCRIITAETR
jgi:hypothetical protein